MPEPNSARSMTFETPKDLGRWLKASHATESELWVNRSGATVGESTVSLDLYRRVGITLRILRDREGNPPSGSPNRARGGRASLAQSRGS